MIEPPESLILDLVLRRISAGDFLATLRASPAEMRAEVAQMLARAVATQDSDRAELALSLGHAFGFEPDTLASLSILADASWHQSHEDVVDALAKLGTPETAEALFRAAVAPLPYRAYDLGHSLRAKAVRALAGLRSTSGIGLLSTLMRGDDAFVRGEAERWLTRICGDGQASEIVRASASVALKLGSRASSHE